jgi:membrane fusion protein, adhesin transport system
MNSSLAIENFEDYPVNTGARWTLWVGMLSLMALVAWAGVSKIDQVTRTQAQVIASNRTQVVQSPDGGVLTLLAVKEGQIVKKGDALATLERARAQAGVDDSSAKVAALRITVARLQAEVFGKNLSFSPELKKYPEYINNQTALYKKRKTAINDDVASLQRALKLSNEELGMNEKLESTGDVSRSDILRLRRQVADLEAQISNKKNKYFQDAQAEMTKAQEDLSTQSEQLRDRAQVLQHTELVAPTNGIVKNIKMTTLGGVLKPGDVLFEILPTEGDLIAEAKVSPTDIASVEMGQSAMVKLDAYDYSIFGTMRGEVTYISADTLTEETRNGPVPYYRVHVLIREAEFKGKNAQKIQVRPGMTATIDIKAMERTVLSYLTKPIVKTFSQSMGER